MQQRKRKAKTLRAQAVFRRAGRYKSVVAKVASKSVIVFRTILPTALCSEITRSLRLFDIERHRMKIQGEDMLLEKCISNRCFEKVIRLMYRIFPFADKVDPWGLAP